MFGKTSRHQKHHFRTQNKPQKVRCGWARRIKYADSENSENFDFLTEDFPVSYVRRVFVLASRGVVMPETLSESSYPLSYTVLRLVKMRIFGEFSLTCRNLVRYHLTVWSKTVFVHVFSSKKFL